jgi:hypothetical protein
VSQIDVVMTPLGGTAWLIGEDFLDKKVVRRVEESTQNRFLIDTVRVALNRSAAAPIGFTASTPGIAPPAKCKD